MNKIPKKFSNNVRSALISTADYCNVGCEFCFRADKGTNALNKTTLSRILSRLYEIGIREICFTGGEPTDHPDFVYFCKLCLQFGIYPNVVTSARTKRQRSNLKFSDRFLTHVTVSADTKWTTDNFTSNRTLESAFTTLDEIKGPSKTLHLLVHKLNEQECSDLAKELLKREITLDISPMINFSREFKFESDFIVDKEQWYEDLKLLSTTFDVSNKLSSLLSDSTQQFECIRQRLYVSSDGIMRWCPYDKNFGVSLLSSRELIHSFLEESVTRLTPHSSFCLAVCKN